LFVVDVVFFFFGWPHSDYLSHPQTGQFNTWTRSLDGKSVDKPLEWIKDMPAYQDFDNGYKRLMTGAMPF
jgi:hypothetical protein